MAKSNTKSGDYERIGRAADGVFILKPAVGPKNFTRTQIEKTVEGVRGRPERVPAKQAAGSALTQSPGKRTSK